MRYADFTHCCICGKKVTKTDCVSGVNFVRHKKCIDKFPSNIHIETQELYSILYSRLK